MSHYKTFVCLAICAFLVSFSFADERTNDSPEQIIQTWAAAFNKNDPVLQLTFYEQSEEIEVIVSAGLQYHGFKRVQQAYQDDQKQLQYFDSKATNITTRILGDVAFVTFEHQFKTKSNEDDSHWRVHIRTSSVLHRIDGKWKIVLEHSSPIQGTERVIQIPKPAAI